MNRPRSWVRDLESLRSFWAVFLHRAGDRRYDLGNRYSRWRPIGAEALIAACYITDHSVGVFLRGPRGERSAATRKRLGVRLDRLAAALGVPQGAEFLLVRRLAADTEDAARWPEFADWLHAAGDRVVAEGLRVMAEPDRIAA